MNQKRLAVLIGITALILIVVESIFIYLQLSEDGSVTDSASQNSLSTTLPEDTQYKVLLEDLETLGSGSNMIISRWDPPYAVYIKYDKEGARFYRPYGEEGGFLEVSEEMVALNLKSGERKVYDIYNDLMPSNMASLLKKMPKEASYRIYGSLLRWSPYTSNVFWGKLSLYSQGDPPLAEEVSFFKFDIQNNQIEKFILPSHGYFGEVYENTNAGQVLYESGKDGLSLYFYDLATKKERLIVSYPKEMFEKYCGGFIEYIYPSSLNVDCAQSRKLEPMWDSEGISYLDFVTRDKVTVKIE